LLVWLSAGGTVQAALHTVVDHGPSSNRVDVVFLGDGYTQSELDAGKYLNHVMSYATHMFQPNNALNDPFGRYAKFFNIHAIDVVSSQSGADKPASGVFVNTALDAAYDSSGIDRLLTVSNVKANAIRNQTLTGTGITAEMQFITVNDTRYGGSGGAWAVFAGGNSSAHEIALHEIGHSFSNLADEYSDLTGSYSGGEPSEPNATRSSQGTKWQQWLGFDDPRGSALDIGAFLGAKRYPAGVYRPSANSKMRTLGQPFNAVSREAFILDIYEDVNPLDGWLNNAEQIADQPLWVDLVDPDVLAVDWYVDDVQVTAAHDESFDAQAYGFGPGSYEVRAHAYDRAVDHAFSGDLLDLVRKNLTSLAQDVTWSVTISAPPTPGDFNGDGVVDAADLTNWTANFGLGQDAAHTQGDADLDGDVDGADFLVWQQGFSAGVAPTAFGEAVPEPAAINLASAASLFALGVFARRWRRLIFSSPLPAACFPVL
jgi:hypothetical protein